MQVLENIVQLQHPWIDPDAAAMEDAALLRPEHGPPLAFTVDFITPIVDDPYSFGAIAAANSLSDVYAMGAQPQVALALGGFPEDLPQEILRGVLEGGRDKAAEAGCVIAGGHTVIDPELKYGLCVLGRVESNQVLSQRGGRAGDRLILTKPIGAGIAAQAIKKDLLSEAGIARAIEVMATLNRGACEAALAVQARCATDVTGFGLAGHLHNVAKASGLAARIRVGSVPLFDFARGFAEAGVIPGGSKRNRKFVEGYLQLDSSLTEVDELLMCDAQTSGGLLIAVAPEHEERLLTELESRGAPVAAAIGELVDGPAGAIHIDP